MLAYTPIPPRNTVDLADVKNSNFCGSGFKLCLAQNPSSPWRRRAEEITLRRKRTAAAALFPLLAHHFPMTTGMLLPWIPPSSLPSSGGGGATRLFAGKTEAHVCVRFARRWRRRARFSPTSLPPLRPPAN